MQTLEQKSFNYGAEYKRNFDEVQDIVKVMMGFDEVSTCVCVSVFLRTCAHACVWQALKPTSMWVVDVTLQSPEETCQATGGAHPHARAHIHTRTHTILGGDQETGGG